MIDWQRRFIFVAAIACAFALAAAAASDIVGKWRAEFTTPDGTQRTNTFTF